VKCQSYHKFNVDRFLNIYLNKRVILVITDVLIIVIITARSFNFCCNILRTNVYFMPFMSQHARTIRFSVRFCHLPVFIFFRILQMRC